MNGQFTAAFDSSEWCEHTCCARTVTAAFGLGSHMEIHTGEFHSHAYAL